MAHFSAQVVLLKVEKFTVKLPISQNGSQQSSEFPSNSLSSKHMGLAVQFMLWEDSSRQHLEALPQMTAQISQGDLNLALIGHEFARYGAEEHPAIPVARVAHATPADDQLGLVFEATCVVAVQFQRDR